MPDKFEFGSFDEKYRINSKNSKIIQEFGYYFSFFGGVGVLCTEKERHSLTQSRPSSMKITDQKQWSISNLRVGYSKQ